MKIELECDPHPDSPVACCEHWDAATQSCNLGFEEIDVPEVFEVCGRCHGKGVHDHPAFSNGITSAEWNGPDWDEDSREAYLSGRYDVSCEVCNGLRVVAVPDFDRLSPDLRARVDAHFEQESRFRAEERAERRMGY